MTPLQLQMLVHYYAFMGDYEQVPANDTRREQCEQMAKVGLLISCADPLDTGAIFEITDKGRFYLRHILATPLPVSVWKIPE